MTKVVINRCFGGFGLSNEAFELLLKKKGIEFDRRESRVSFGQERYEYYRKGYLGNDEYYLSDYDFYDDRSDSALIQVVEELGQAANGWAADLAVLEVPDDVEWHIHEYDGREHVAENHRTWY